MRNACVALVLSGDGVSMPGKDEVGVSRGAILESCNAERVSGVSNEEIWDVELIVRLVWLGLGDGVRRAGSCVF